MRITDIRETSIALNSTLKNSSIDFSEMTTSVVAVITDVKRDGKPVIGYAFNSTGRYACGAQMRARFIPRILKAAAEVAAERRRATISMPAKVLAVMMRNEKSGGHSERSIGIGTIEVALWDAVAKIAGKPLHVLLAERLRRQGARTNASSMSAAAGMRPARAFAELQDEMKRHLDAGYTMVKMKVGGAPLDEDMRRIEAVKSILPSHAELAVDANSKFDRAEALRYAKAMTPYQLRWFEEPCDPLDYATLSDISDAYPHALSTGENLFSTQDVENLVRFGNLKPARRDVIQVDPPQAYGITQYARTLPGVGEIPVAALGPLPAWRQPDVARDRGRLRPRRRGKLSGRVRRVRGLRRRCGDRERLHFALRPAGHRLRRAGGVVCGDADLAA